MMKVMAWPITLCLGSSTALAQNPAFDICNTLATSGLINKHERTFAEQTATQQFHEICREKGTRVVKANSSSAGVKAHIFGKGQGSGNYQRTGQFDQTEVDNFCDKGAQAFARSVAEQEITTIGDYLADSVNTCLRLATQYQLEWTAGIVEVDPGADNRFIVDVRHIPGRTSERYKLEQLVGSEGVSCFLDNEQKNSALGTELGGQNSYNCTREPGQPVAARLIFVGTGNPSNKINVPIRATSTSAIERLKAELQKELLPTNAIVPFVSDSCPIGWKELSAPGRFLVGASATQRGGEQGGRDSVTLDKGNLPPHQHAVYPHAGYPLGRPAARHEEEGAAATDRVTGVHPGVTSDGGFANQPFQIMPPWMAVRYCQRSELTPISSERR